MNSAFRLYATIKFNRPLKPGEMISPGGYTINTTFGEYTFDFTEYEGTVSDDDPACIEIMCKNPDYDYEDTIKLTPTDFKHVISFDDFYVDMEGCKEDLKIVEIKDVMIQFFFNSCVDDIRIPNHVLEDYCKKNIAA